MELLFLSNPKFVIVSYGSKCVSQNISSDNGQWEKDIMMSIILVTSCLGSKLQIPQQTNFSGNSRLLI